MICNRNQMAKHIQLHNYIMVHAFIVSITSLNFMPVSCTELIPICLSIQVHKATDLHILYCVLFVLHGTT